MDDEQLLRTAEVAAILTVGGKPVSESTVVKWARAGLLRAKRTGGGHRRYLRSSVRELQAVLDMDDGDMRRAALESLKRHNAVSRGEPLPE